MDPLSALLDAEERTSDLRLCASWSVVLGPSAGLTLVAVADGPVWCHRDDAAPLLLERGDLVVLRRTGTRILSHSETPPAVAVRARGRRDVVEPVVVGERGPGGARLFVRSFLGATTAPSGFFSTLTSEHVFTTARDSHMWPPLREEAEHLSVATSSVITRLIDLLFVDAVRRWAADGDAQGWMRAVLDPVVGSALRLFHEQPGHPWTLDEVADHIGTSRASLSRRFQSLVGEPPMTYLREWRLTRAATILDEEGASVASAARRSGFADPFEFSSAFFKKYGVSPARYRAGASAGSA